MVELKKRALLKQKTGTLNFIFESKKVIGQEEWSREKWSIFKFLNVKWKSIHLNI